uniref:Uncharacterized protein n=1 Tax=Zosterops lateralis melanops TaxID=1220523 RepID=A0A8D2PGJ0_ZOSLA
CGFCCFALRTLILSGEFQKKETPMGYCSPKCRVMDMKYTSGDCKYSCCVPPAPWKGK